MGLMLAAPAGPSPPPGKAGQGREAQLTGQEGSALVSYGASSSCRLRHDRCRLAYGWFAGALGEGHR